MFELDNLSADSEKRFDTVSASSNTASDHAAVWNEFNL